MAEDLAGGGLFNFLLESGPDTTSSTTWDQLATNSRACERPDKQWKLLLEAVVLVQTQTRNLTLSSSAPDDLVKHSDTFTKCVFGSEMNSCLN